MKIDNRRKNIRKAFWKGDRLRIKPKPTLAERQETMRQSCLSASRKRPGASRRKQKKYGR